MTADENKELASYRHLLGTGENEPRPPRGPSKSYKHGLDPQNVQRAKDNNIELRVYSNRIQRGWSEERASTFPVKKRKSPLASQAANSN